ncbi:MAG TPA: Gfo/Idh/MocA family oxidoreductase, partial [Spirochaetia bacterium]|nr:Gfo/Idh/MocA family oxidoreductase [Spirochaetia bacterium]
ASFPDVEIAAVCDLNPDRLDATARKYGIEKTYTDHRKMISEIAPHGVYVIGPPTGMFDIWIWCLKEKLNLYIEKPMGITLHQAQMLAELAEKAGVITQVSHQRRSCPLLVTMRDKCLEKGPITHSVCEFYKSQIQPQYSALDHMVEDCIHSIDTVRWMCGGEVVDLDSHCRRVGTPDLNWIGAMLYFDNGSTGIVLNSWSSGRRVFRVEMHAPNIYVDAEVEGKATVYADGDYTGVEFDTKEVAGSDELYVYGGFRAKNREFIDSLKSGKDVTSSPFRDCLKTMEAASKILALSLMKSR